MRTSALFSAKNFRYFKIYGVSARTRWVEPVRTREEGANFSIFCADVFYERPLLVFEHKLFFKDKFEQDQSLKNYQKYLEFYSA